MELIPLDKIIINDEDRQRKALTEIEGLVESIKRIGLLNPITITRDHVLLAGRRRLEAYRRLGYTDIPARYYDSLSKAEQRLVELDENIRRVDLDWKERALATLELHELLSHDTISKTAEYCGLDVGEVSRHVSVGKALRSGDQKILACTGIRQAAELLHRRRVLEFQTTLSQIGDPGHEDKPDDKIAAPYSDGFGEETLPATTDQVLGRNAQGPSSGIKRPATRSPFTIQAGDFVSWADTYSGPKFNLIHCDFPYGIDFDQSAAARIAGEDSGYKDDSETFWRLTNALLRNQERLVLSSAHMLFWFSMRYYTDLINALETHNWFVHYLPLIWHKSDGSGIASDYRRRPKHVYETALWCSLGDRPISQLKNDVFAHPIARQSEGHVSAKPEPMLRHFLAMGVTEHTIFLDPTCGSGTSLRAAHALGAARGLGLELNPDMAQSARLKLEAALTAEEDA